MVADSQACVESRPERGEEDDDGEWEDFRANDVAARVEELKFYIKMYTIAPIVIRRTAGEG